MTKRLKLLYPEEPPSTAPDVVWMPDAANLDLVVERFPDAAGYLDLDNGDLEVRPDALDPDAIRTQIFGRLREEPG